MNSPSFRKTAVYRPGRRRGLALMLAVLTAIGGPVVFVTGQVQNTPTASAQSSLALQKKPDDEEVFVMRRNERGESVCRAATPEEKSRLSKRGDAAGPTRIIYPGGKRPWEDDRNATAPVATETGTPLQPSAGIRIILHGTQQLQNNVAARDAFIVAANRWEALISTPITVVIDADFGTTFFGDPFPDPDILGLTGTAERNFNLSDVRQQLIINAPGPEESQLYNALPTIAPVDFNFGFAESASRVRLTRTTSRALGLTPDITNPDALQIGQGDAGIGFNSAHSFDFTPDNITPGQLDFDAVVVHEIGHALGFTSESGGGFPSPISMWDLFRFRPGTASLATMATAPRVMGSDGSQVFFNNRTNTFGTMELALSTGGPSGQAGDGEQSSHWKNDVGGNPFIGIMDPTLASGRREMLTQNDINALDTFGYKIGGTSVLPPPPPPPPPAPPNDNFANAQSVFGCVGDVAGTNVSATREAGEPNHSPDNNGGSRSVWYQWQSPSNSIVTFITRNSDFDTVLGVYTGTDVGSLTLIGKNDDLNPGVEVASSVTFTATAGTIYRIAVDGYNNQNSGGDDGTIRLHWGADNCSTASNVSFSSAAFSVSEGVDANGIGFEGTGFRTITVQRTGSLAVPASVDYSTSNGSAESRKDYAQSAGTLRFGQNENSKSFIVFVTDDVFQESPETVNLTLSNPVGTTLGSTPTTVLTINSNDAATGPNPVDPNSFNTGFFVRQHYLDFFTREPDLSGFNFWKNEIDQCTNEPCREVRRVNVSGAFFLSIEFQQTGYLVYRTFTTAFGPTRIGGTVPLTLTEFVPDVQRIGLGFVFGAPGADALLEANKQAYFNEFVTRPQFVAQYPSSLTPGQFVDALNANALALSQAERDALVADLMGGVKTRAQVLRAVAEDSDLGNAHFNRAFVLMQYFGYMRRNPPDPPEPTLDFQGYAFWLNKLNQFNGNFVNAEMVKAFIISTEYRQRFGP